MAPTMIFVIDFKLLKKRQNMYKMFTAKSQFASDHPVVKCCASLVHEKFDDMIFLFFFESLKCVGGFIISAIQLCLTFIEVE